MSYLFLTPTTVAAGADRPEMSQRGRTGSGSASHGVRDTWVDLSSDELETGRDHRSQVGIDEHHWLLGNVRDSMQPAPECW